MQEFNDNADVEYIEDGEMGSLEERGEAVREANSLMDNIRPHLPYLASTKPAEDAKITYAAGKKFIVVKPGARLEGIRTFGKFQTGYSEALDVGDVIVSTGWREGLCGNGFMEANFATETSPLNTLWLQFWPMQGLFLPWPMTGWLEPFSEDRSEEIKTEQAEAERLRKESCCPAGMSCEDCGDLGSSGPGFVER